MHRNAHHTSRYEQKYTRRKKAGAINYEMPVDREGNPTLNEQHFIYRDGKRVMRNFTRVRRTEEV